jgi:flagellar hook protein FlgE
MIDSIYIAMSALHGYEQGLRVISNDTANLNTPGFKNSVLQFADASSSGDFGAARQYGYGLTTLGTRLNFQQGQIKNTGNPLDLALDGDGLFVLRDSDGHVRYTRDGQFKFNDEGVLVSTTSGEEVMALDGSGSMARIDIGGLKASAAKATQTVQFSGNLSSTATTATVGSVVVIDAAGTSHTLSVKLDPVSGSPGTWTVTLLDGTTAVGTAEIAFLAGRPDPARAKATITYQPSRQPDMPITLDFSTNVTSYDSGSRSTVAMASQDGFASGNLTGTSFDANGVLQLQYSNNQTVTGPRLALARFASQDAIAPAGNNEYAAKDGRGWQTGVASEAGFGAIRPESIETSNVDLSQEFSDLVIMQRGYQAASQVISTANEMLGELFAMRGSK